MSIQGTAVRRASDEPARAIQLDSVGKGEALGWARKPVCATVLLTSDLFTIGLALQLAILMRAYLIPQLGVTSPPTFGFWHYLSLGWPLLFFPMLYCVEGLYTQRRTLWKEIAFLTKATSLGVIAVFAGAALGKQAEWVSRLTLLLLGMNLLVLMPLSRYAAKWSLGALGLWSKELLILGATDTARLALLGLEADPILGYRVIGVLDDDDRKHGLCVGMSCKGPVHVLGPIAWAQDLLERGEARDILIAMPDLPEGKLLRLVHQLQGLSETVYVVPNLWGLPMMNLQLDGFLDQQVQMLKVSNNLAKPWNQWLKRGFDIVFATLLVVIALPILGLLALLIRLDSAGSALLRQKRLGHRDEDFNLWKFRSMHVNADEKLEEYLRQNPALAEEWRRYAKLRSNDPRLTRVGRSLRRWSLDELPQIFNVLRGEMSLVGPRPYLPRERDRIGAHLSTILTARPGMTGFWQVNGKNKLAFEDRVRLEVWYVRNWSLWLDLIILVKTVGAVLRKDHTD